MENNLEEKSYVQNQVISKENLKTNFENGDVPDEQDFWEWQDSYWHKNDPNDVIPSDRVDLSGKADKNATNLDGENVQNWRAKLNIKDPDPVIPASSTQSGIVDNVPLQELGGVDKAINEVRIGKGAGNSLAIREDSTIIGKNALSSNTMGTNNTATGIEALKVNTTGSFNAGFGDYVLWKNTTGIWNTALGSASLLYNTTGQRNVAVGTALYWNETGNRNTGIGVNAGYANVKGSNNTYIGNVAAYDNGLGNYNVAIGNGAMAIATGGYLSAGSSQNLNRNVFIGSLIQGSADLNDTLAIDNKGATATAASNALLYGGFSLANRFLKINGSFSTNPSYMPNAQGDATYTKNIVAKADGAFGWEDKTNLTLNNVGRWNSTTNNWSNGVILDDGTKIGIGVSPNSTTNSAQLNFKATDRKIMNIPKTSFLSSYLNGLPSQNQQSGDIYNNGDNIFWVKQNNSLERWKKLTGFDVDYINQLPTDFNSLKTTYSDTVNNPNFDILDKHGFANIWTADYCYGQKLTERFTSITNADSRMYEGVLTNINTGIFWYNGGVQQYHDIKGNLFLRGTGSAYSEKDWKKVITDSLSKTTTLGSENTYNSAKFAIDSTTKGFLLPRMTRSQRDQINTPVAGLLIFQTDNTPGLRCYNGTNWIKYSETID